MAPKTKSGFKKCTRCTGTMSGTDPHNHCLKCLGYRHDSASCEDCKAMTPKALRHREQQLLMRRMSQAPQSWSRSRSRSKRHSRHRSHSSSRRPSDKSSSSKSDRSTRHRKKHRSHPESRSPPRPLSSRLPLRPRATTPREAAAPDQAVPLSPTSLLS